MVLAQKQKTDEWKRTESPEINPHVYGQIIFDKGAKNIQWRKGILFSKQCWESWEATCRMNETTAVCPHILGWPKSLVRFVYKVKTTFFTFTNNFIDLDMLSVSAISCYWVPVVEPRGAAKHLLMHKAAPQQRLIWPKCQ